MEKFRAFTREEAINKAKIALGENIDIIDEKKIETKSFLGLFKRIEYEIVVRVRTKNKKKDSFFINTSNNSSSKSFSKLVYYSNVHDEMKKNAGKILEILKKNDSKNFIKNKELQSHKKEEKNEKANENNQLEKDINNLDIEVNGLKRNASIIYEFIKKNNNIGMFNNNDYSDEVKEIYDFLKFHKVNEGNKKYICDSLETFIKNRGNNKYPDIKEKFKDILKGIIPSKNIYIHENETKIISIVGPTGVGKTTTLAKIALKWRTTMEKISSYDEKNYKGVFFTLDVYRLGAQEQSSQYCDIISGFEHVVVTDIPNFKSQVENYLAKNYKMIIIDVSGRSPKEQKDILELSSLLSEVNSENYLAISSIYKEEDMKHIMDVFSVIRLKGTIFTKLDETDKYGFFINLHDYLKKFPVCFLTKSQIIDNYYISPDPNLWLSIFTTKNE